MNGNGLKVFSGNGNPKLTQEICDTLGIPLGKALVTRFSDGEIRVEIGENVRGKDVFIVQPLSSPVNDNFMELLLMIDAGVRASAYRITAVIPYYGYARQDRKNKPRVPIAARLVADMITMAGANRVLTLDLHAGQIQGFFKLPVDNLYASPLFHAYIRDHFNNNLVIVSPDAGGVIRARAYAKKLGVGIALIDKRRDEVNQAKAFYIVGDVRDKSAIVLDDIIDTGGTLREATNKLLEEGAKEVYALISHAVLSGSALETIENSLLKRLVVTDTLPLSNKAECCEKIIKLSASALFAKAIDSIHKDDSVSSLFEIQH